jgi:hypothetical protein
MKNKLLLTLIILFPLVFTACDEGKVEPTPTSGIVIEDVYTSVANTLAAAQASAVTPTPLPSATAMPTNTSLPTQTPMTATLPAARTVVVATSGGCYNSAYVSDVTIPDGTKMYPGQSFTKTWKISNSGTCAWTEDFTLVHVSGDAMSASTVKLSEAVAVGKTLSISVSMVAPSTTGTYYSYWAVANSAGTAIGPSVYVMIVVTTDATTSTPTPTKTTTASTVTKTSASYTATTAKTSVSYTSTATNTTAPAATNTTAPVSTDTTVPLPTDTTVPPSEPTVENTAEGTG